VSAYQANAFALAYIDKAAHQYLVDNHVLPVRACTRLLRRAGFEHRVSSVRGVPDSFPQILPNRLLDPHVRTPSEKHNVRYPLALGTASRFGPNTLPCRPALVLLIQHVALRGTDQLLLSRITGHHVRGLHGEVRAWEERKRRHPRASVR